MLPLEGSGRGMDAYFTPKGIAEAAVDCVSVEPKVIMDAAVGDGALLRAAAAKWPQAHIVGLDVDQVQLRRAKANHPQWTFGRMDMFSRRSRAASTLWNSALGSVDLVLLNPPFSYRGGKYFRVVFEGVEYGLTPASSFIAESLSRLSPRGELVALLPAGILELERDAAFWSAVSKRWLVEIRDRFSSTAFSGTRTKSILVSVTQRQGRPLPKLADFSLRPESCVEVVRGRVPVHALRPVLNEDEAVPFLHTKDLSGLSVGVISGAQSSRSLATVGPFVTLPRVGRVLREHIQVVGDPRLIVISDCVFALRVGNAEELELLHAVLVRDFEALQGEYVGGCAPYLTIRRLVEFLSRRGYCPHHVAASSLPRFDAVSAPCFSDISGNPLN